MPLKRLPVLFLLLCLIIRLSCSTGSNTSSDDRESGSDVLPPVYVTFYAHNEDNWQNHVADDESYTAYRNNLLEKRNLLSDYGATLNWQSDIVVLQGMLVYEKGAMLENTGGKTISW